MPLLGCVGVAGANDGAASDSASSHGGGRIDPPRVHRTPQPPCESLSSFDDWGHGRYCPALDPCQDSPTPRLCACLERVLGVARSRALWWVLGALISLRVVGYLVLRRRRLRLMRERGA